MGLHPDKNPGSESHEKFVKLNEAFTTLKNADTRRQYDMSIGKYTTRTTPQGTPFGGHYHFKDGPVDWRTQWDSEHQKTQTQRLPRWHSSPVDFYWLRHSSPLGILQNMADG